MRGTSRWFHFLHFYNPSACILNARWRKAWLYCSKCGEPIAFRAGDTCYVYDAFRKQAHFIATMCPASKTVRVLTSNQRKDAVDYYRNKEMVN